MVRLGFYVFDVDLASIDDPRSKFVWLEYVTRRGASKVNILI